MDINSDIFHDLNGDYYVAGSSGEKEEVFENRHLFIYTDDAAKVGLEQVLDMSKDADRQVVVNTILLNYVAQMSTLSGQNAKHDDAWKIAFGRGIAVRLGLIDASGNHSAHGLRYSDVVLVDPFKLGTGGKPTQDPFTFEMRESKEGGFSDKEEVNPKKHKILGYDSDTAKKWRKQFIGKFCDCVCMVAFFMRTRAHHCLDDFTARYAQVWRKCLHNEDSPGLPWMLIAHNMLHAIYPDTLDKFWIDSSNKARCAGALTKRLYSYGAGTAAYGAVQAGAQDLCVVFPKIKTLLSDAFAELERCANVLDRVDGRWAGCVNKRFYKGADFVINERKLAPLAAVVMGALKAGAVAGSLADSNALNRVAGAAQITGTFITQMLQKASQHDRMVLGLLPPSDGVEYEDEN